MGIIRKHVRDGDVDLGIVLVNDTAPGFDSEKIFSGEYRLYQSAKRNYIGCPDERGIALAKKMQNRI
jgi:DNA-binding transcriptional LysR family regulator